jgi:hypothetical protein
MMNVRMGMVRRPGTRPDAVGCSRVFMLPREVLAITQPLLQERYSVSLNWHRRRVCALLYGTIEDQDSALPRRQV